MSVGDLIRGMDEMIISKSHALQLINEGKAQASGVTTHDGHRYQIVNRYDVQRVDHYRLGDDPLTCKCGGTLGSFEAHDMVPRVLRSAEVIDGKLVFDSQHQTMCWDGCTSDGSTNGVFVTATCNDCGMIHENPEIEVIFD